MKTINYFILLLLMPLANISCQNEKKMEVDYLIHLLDKKENYNKYLFSDGYEPFVMVRAKYDYVDAHMTSFASANYFSMEKRAITYKKSYPLEKSATSLLRCLYINERGQISEIIKRKINVSYCVLDSLNINLNDIAQGTSRLYDGQFLTDPNAFLSEIISTREFYYYVIERSNDDVFAYKVEILNNNQRDLVTSRLNKGEHKDVYFYRALLIYDEEGNFVELKVLDS